MSDDIDIFGEDTAAGFRLVSIDIAGLAEPVARFAFGTRDAGGTYEVALDPAAPNIEQALAEAAKTAAADIGAWAQEAEDFAATASAGGLLALLSGA